MGTQDSFEEAQDFREQFGIESFEMLWDPSFASWQALGVRGQPNAILFDADGKGHFIFPGYLDTEAVLAEAAKL